MRRVSNFDQSINWDNHMKDHIEICHLTEYDAFKVNRDQVIDLEIWFKIHTNVSNFKTASPCKMSSCTYYLREAEMKIAMFAHSKEYHETI